MVVDKKVFANMLVQAAEYMQAKTEYLSEMDSCFGDGDHGITIGKIAALIQEKVSQGEEAQDIKSFLDDLGMAIMEVRGGSAGPLYGTLIGGLGVDLNDGENTLEAEGVKRMFTGCLSEMEDITTAKVGDKTMMDAPIPAVEAAQKTEGSVKDILEAAARAAENGAKDSEKYVSKFGRARSYKEQTIGTPDAGAVSTSIFIRGLSDGMK